MEIGFLFNSTRGKQAEGPPEGIADGFLALRMKVSEEVKFESPQRIALKKNFMVVRDKSILRYAERKSNTTITLTNRQANCPIENVKYL